MIKIIKRTSAKKAEGDEMCLESSSAEHRMTGAGTKSQCLNTKMQNGKLQKKTKKKGGVEERAQWTQEEVRDRETTDHWRWARCCHPTQRARRRGREALSGRESQPLEHGAWSMEHRASQRSRAPLSVQRSRVQPSLYRSRLPRVIVKMLPLSYLKVKLGLANIFCAGLAVF